MGIRPEKLQIAKGRGGRLNGTLIEEAYYGDVSTLLVELAGGQRIRVSRTNRHREETQTFDPGDAVTLNWEASDMLPWACLGLRPLGPPGLNSLCFGLQVSLGEEAFSQGTTNGAVIGGNAICAIRPCVGMNVEIQARA